MHKIKKYLFNSSIKYVCINQVLILFLVIFINIIELSRVIEKENQSLLNFIYLSFLKIPSIINETSPFVIIISTAFLFRYLIKNNELIAMRNVGFNPNGLMITRLPVNYRPNKKLIWGTRSGRYIANCSNWLRWIRSCPL